MSHFYVVVRAIVRVLVSILFPMRVTGLNNIPATGAVMLVSNHISLIDPVFIICALSRPIRFMAKEELFRCKPLGWFLSKMGAFPVARGNSDLSAIRTSIAVLNEGCMLGIYPQGHRYKHDETRELQTGAAMLALRSKAAVVPVRMHAPLRLFRPMRIEIGPAVNLNDLPRATSAALNEATARIAAGIWKE